MTHNMPWPAAVAATAGIVGSAWNAGGMGMLSALAVPGLLAAPVGMQNMARQWEALYNRGKAMGPRLAAISLLGFGYLAYANRGQGRQWTPYLLAGLLSIGIVPFTLIVMMSTNNALTRVASGASAEMGDQAVRQLMAKWQALNLVRSLFPLSASLLACWALLG